jgi:hypothetical protein
LAWVMLATQTESSQPRVGPEKRRALGWQ